MANYFRWFGVPEAPFGWYYEVLAVFAKISTASPLMRLPALLAGILCWMVISREVVPRLGRAVRRSNVALWTGGLVFLAFWLPVQQRSSPRAHRRPRRTAHLVLHRARHRHRTSAARGHGNLDRRLHSCRRTHRIDVYRSPSRRRAARWCASSSSVTDMVGTLPLLAPIAAAGILVLVVIFADQTFAGVMEATRVRTIIGPNLEWYQDFLRYYYLFVQTVDGSVARRFAFLTMLLCLFTTLFVLLRRGRVPGVGNRSVVAPGRRRLRHDVPHDVQPHQVDSPLRCVRGHRRFSRRADRRGRVRVALRSRRNRSVFVAGLLLMLALSFAGINGYWYVSSYGVPWFDKTISYDGRESNTLFLVLFALALAFAAWQYLREGFAAPHREAEHGQGQTNSQVRGRSAHRDRRSDGPVRGALAPQGRCVAVPGVLAGPKSNIEALAGKTCGTRRGRSGRDRPQRRDSAASARLPDSTPRIRWRSRSRRASPPTGSPAISAADYIEVKPGQGNTDSQSVGPTFDDRFRRRNQRRHR